MTIKSKYNIRGLMLGVTFVLMLAAAMLLVSTSSANIPSALNENFLETNQDLERFDRMTKLNKINAKLSAELEAQLECLAKNIYHEARSESRTGQRAVAWVTLNRVSDPKFPNTVCGVVYQGRVDANGNPLRHQCQFSWYCDGKSDRIHDHTEWSNAKDIARTVWHNHKKNPDIDPTMGSTMYHATWMESFPSWARSHAKVVRIDNHVFYK